VLEVTLLGPAAEAVLQWWSSWAIAGWLGCHQLMELLLPEHLARAIHDQQGLGMGLSQQDWLRPLSPMV